MNTAAISKSSAVLKAFKKESNFKTYITKYSGNTLSPTKMNNQRKNEKVAIGKSENILMHKGQKFKKKQYKHLPLSSHHKEDEGIKQRMSIKKGFDRYINIESVSNGHQSKAPNSQKHSNIYRHWRDNKYKSINPKSINSLFNYVVVKDDPEWVGFMNYMNSNLAKSGHFMKIIEQERDLFTVNDDYSLAHCVAEDLKMGCGIAVEFRRRFPNVKSLNMREQSGGLIAMKDKGRYIYYMVTKRKSSGKPTYTTFWNSLKRLRDHMKQNQIGKLAIPRIGCGLDRLDWNIVKLMLEFVFHSLDVFILVCNFRQNNGRNKYRTRNDVRRNQY